LLKAIELPPEVASKTAEAPQFCRGVAGRAGLASTTFDGKLSVSDVWVRSPLMSLLLIVIVNKLVSPTNIVLGEKDLLKEGGATPMTVSVALAGVVLVIVTPPPVESNALVGIVLIRLPEVDAVTSIPTVHSPGVIPLCAGTIPPLRANVVDPGTAVILPPQVLETFAGFAIDNPGCTPTRLSVQEALVSGNEFGLYIVTLRRDMPPDEIAIGVKLLLISAGNDSS
jgi:hypothetical protein